jgi:hypothetical protein
MATGNDDKADAVVALVTGAIIGVAVTLLFIRMQRKRAIGSKAAADDYYYDGGDLFI